MSLRCYNLILSLFLLVLTSCVYAGSGVWEEMNCFNDSDCTGYNGWDTDGVPYDCCQDSSTCACVSESYRIWYCNTTVNLCDFTTNDSRISTYNCYDCGEDFCDSYGASYCEADDVYHARNCYERGCEDAICISSFTKETELVEVCTYGCDNGKCITLESMVTLEPKSVNVGLGSKDINLAQLTVRNRGKLDLDLQIEFYPKTFPASINWIKFIPEEGTTINMEVNKGEVEYSTIYLIIAPRLGAYEYDVIIEDINTGQTFSTKFWLNVITESMGTGELFYFFTLLFAIYLLLERKL